MHQIKRYLTSMILVFVMTFMTPSTTYFEASPPSSLADRLYGSFSKDPWDRVWPADLTGLPNRGQVDLLTQRVIQVMFEDTDIKCISIDSNLRKMILQHFVIYQQMLNAQGIYLDEHIARQWAHILAMVLKESSGDTTSITDMSGRSISTYEPSTDLLRWRHLLNLSKKSRIKMNDQTNFGLTQISLDQLFSAFNLNQNQIYGTEYLGGGVIISAPRKIILNTAATIRRLIWFYQDFAQGRIFESDTRIHPQDIDKPDLISRYQTGLKMALLYCGTRLMFLEGSQNDVTKLQDAMASIAYCKLGHSQIKYGGNEMNDKCFVAWVILCPALNIDIATLTPLSYFATRNEKPVCENTFKRLLNKNPRNHRARFN